MSDQTEENFRRLRSAELNKNPSSREELEKEHGQVWDTEGLVKDFDVEGFVAPYVVVVRRSDGQRGSLEFQHSPRFYFNFHPHTERY